jgi:hypothetical protein
MLTNIQDIPIVLSYDAIVLAQAKRKRLSMLKKLPEKGDISALALISRYLGKTNGHQDIQIFILDHINISNRLGYIL